MPSHDRFIAIGACLAIAVVVCLLVGWRDRRALLAVVLIVLAWFAYDNAWEGPVLLPVAPGHGLTLADVPGVGALAAAATVWLRARN